MYARGQLTGLTRGTRREHIVRAALEAIAYQSYDLVSAMEADTGVRLNRLSVDGGASQNGFLMQFQADILDKPVRRPRVFETTALGVCYLAGLAVGVWNSPSELRSLRKADTEFTPSMDAENRGRLLSGWRHAVGQCVQPPK
jgi:glycerol kinase